MGQVRIVSAICENCGPMTAGRFKRDNFERCLFPITATPGWARSKFKCSDCGEQVVIATEPVALTKGGNQ